MEERQKIDWKRKLASRKLWMAAAGFVSGLLLCLGSPENSAEAIGALVLAAGSVVGYIVGEGLVDSAPK
ncbi:MAG: hypothetical protein LBD02_04450 [Christensenellaceae bacterium]|jgi:hypothetical protein|nr:hypothetical protein [Christensenellaceae bacterium]